MGCGSLTWVPEAPGIFLTCKKDTFFERRGQHLRSPAVCLQPCSKVPGACLSLPESGRKVLGPGADGQFSGRGWAHSIRRDISPVPGETSGKGVGRNVPCTARSQPGLWPWSWPVLPCWTGTRQGILQGAGQGTLVLSLMFGFQAEAVRQALARNSKSPEYGL